MTLRARQSVLYETQGLDAWVYRGNEWLITKPDAPHVAREAWTVKFEPKVVANVAENLQRVAKIVGVSDDLEKMRRCEADAQAAFGSRASATRSQPYYLDVTNKDANKGAVVEYLAKHVGVKAEEIATIGDQPNDVLMFERSGFSIAMGNASDEVKARASTVTNSYNDEGFAKAIERFILGTSLTSWQTLDASRYCPTRHSRGTHGGVDDSRGVGGGWPLPGLALRRVDAEGALHAAGFGAFPQPLSVAARALVLGRRAFRSPRPSRKQLSDDARDDACQSTGAAGEHSPNSDRRGSRRCCTTL